MRILLPVYRCSRRSVFDPELRTLSMRPRILLACLAVVDLVLAGAVAGCRVASQPDASPRTSSAAQRLDATQCMALWVNGFETEGVVGGRATRAYFDTASLNGAEERVSGIVVPSERQSSEALADSVTAAIGRNGDLDCDVRLQGEEGIDDSVWQLRIDSSVRVTGTHRTTDGRTEPVAFTVVPETSCDGAGEWRTFSSPAWPIVFEYPADWTITADEDDVNLECPSVTRLASGGSYLTFERGQFPQPDRKSVADDDSFTEPYWFLRRAGDDWRVKDVGCDSEAKPGSDDGCYPARRSERNGMTVLQGAAGEHRTYRAGIGYMGQGGGIMRYLWVLGDRWISLDSTESSRYDDVGRKGGPVLIDGHDVGDRVVRSVRLRAAGQGETAGSSPS
jgi:hypothetical protein